MIRDLYADAFIEQSRRELAGVLDVVRPPAYLVGGWAVHLHVDAGFRAATGASYLGSRDIDVGVHVDADWDRARLLDSPVAGTLAGLRDRGWVPSRFGFARHFHRDTGAVVTEEEAAEVAPYDLFTLFVDLIPDTDDLAAFRDAFGFQPPGDALLRTAFREELGRPMGQVQHVEAPDGVRLAPVDLLGAMKVRAIPMRNKDDKRIKDVADLHGLLWYGGDHREVRRQVRRHLSDEDLDRLRDHLDPGLHRDAADLLEVDAALVRASIEALFAEPG